MLAEGAAPAAPAFEADFYVATATVIPVLPLALIVQDLHTGKPWGCRK